MAQELLVAGAISADDLQEFVRVYKCAPDKTFMLLESQPEHMIAPEERQNHLLFAFFDPNFTFASFSSGRIFHQGGELRWERRLSSVQIVFTGEATYQPVLPNHQEKALVCYKKVSRRYFLFGKRLDDEQVQRIGPPAQIGDFAEVRIPRLLRYPISPATNVEYVQLAVSEYVSPTTGVNIAYRFYDLLPFQQQGSRKTS